MQQKPPIDLNLILRQSAWELEMYGVTPPRPAFACGLNLYKLVWVFFAGSLAGVVLETLLRLFATGQLVRTAGMLYGPFNQVYGLGAVVFLLVLYPLRGKNGVVILAVGTAAGLLFEYAASLLQEVLFRSESWNYSDVPFNLDGRTNLLYGLGWGLLGFLFIRHLWPCLSGLVERFPPRPGRVVTLLVAALLCVNMGLSAAAVTRWQRRDAGRPAGSVVARWLDEAYPDEVMQEKYPGLEFKKR